MNYKRLLIGIGIFCLLEVIALTMFYYVWVTAPTENINWLENNYGGLFKFLIFGVFNLSCFLISLKGSIDLSKKL